MEADGLPKAERRRLLSESIKNLLAFRMALDPTDSVPVYDLHFSDGGHTGYALVRVDWLDEVWGKAREDDEMLPHDHLSPEDWGV